MLLFVTIYEDFLVRSNQPSCSSTETIWFSFITAATFLSNDKIQFTSKQPTARPSIQLTRKCRLNRRFSLLYYRPFNPLCSLHICLLPSFQPTSLPTSQPIVLPSKQPSSRSSFETTVETAVRKTNSTTYFTAFIWTNYTAI